MNRSLTVLLALLGSAVLAFGQAGERDVRRQGGKPPGEPGKPGKERPRGERDGPGPRGGERRGPGPGRGARHHADHFLATHDHDKDSTVTFAEFQQSDKIARISEEGKKRLFDRLDKNMDGKISRDELPKGGGDGGGPNWGDLNRDGKITAEEFYKNPRLKDAPLERKKAMFARMDQNKDGVLTREDFRRLGRGSFFDRASMEKLDQNGDKALSFEEWKKHPRLKEGDGTRLKEIFGRLDRNKDGVLNEADRPERPRRGPGSGPGPGDGPNGRRGPGPGPDGPAPSDRPRPGGPTGLPKPE